MKTDIFMPFYVGDYLKDTMHLTARDHGCYLLLIMAYWTRQGPLPDDDDHLSGVAKCTAQEWPAVRKKLERFFILSDFSLGTSQPQSNLCSTTGQPQPEHGSSRVWRHKRIDEELAKANARRVTASLKGKAGGKKSASQRVRTTAQAQVQPQSNLGSTTGQPQPEHGSSTSPSPSHIAGEREHGRDAERPSIEEVKAYADTIGLAEWKATDWLDEMQGCGWLDFQHRPVNDWKAVLRRVKVKWEADGRPEGPPARIVHHGPAPNTQGTSPAMKSMLATKELERVEARMRDIQAGYSEHQDWSKKDVEEFRALRKRKKELVAELGFKA